MGSPHFVQLVFTRGVVVSENQNFKIDQEGSDVGTTCFYEYSADSCCG